MSVRPTNTIFLVEQCWKKEKKKDIFTEFSFNFTKFNNYYKFELMKHENSTLKFVFNKNKNALEKKNNKNMVFVSWYKYPPLSLIYTLVGDHSRG